MANRDCRVVVAMVLPEDTETTALLASLATCAALERRDPELHFVHCRDLAAAQALALQSGELQVAVVDAQAVTASHAALVTLRQCRPELDLFLITDRAPGAQPWPLCSTAVPQTW